MRLPFFNQFVITEVELFTAIIVKMMRRLVERRHCKVAGKWLDPSAVRSWLRVCSNGVIDAALFWNKDAVVP